MLLDQLDRRERALAARSARRCSTASAASDSIAASASSVNQPCSMPCRWSRRIGSFSCQSASASASRYLAGVALVVAAQPVGQALEQERAAARARRGEVAAEGVPHGDDVVAVDGVALDVVGRDDVADPLDVRVRRARRELREAVVLAHQDQRQLPERREVDRLVEVPGLHGAVAEEHDRDRVVAAQPRRERAARARSGCCRPRRRSRP